MNRSIPDGVISIAGCPGLGMVQTGCVDAFIMEEATCRRGSRGVQHHPTVQRAKGSALIQQTTSDMKLPPTAYSCRRRKMSLWAMQLYVGMLHGHEKSQFPFEVLQRACFLLRDKEHLKHWQPGLWLVGSAKE